MELNISAQAPQQNTNNPSVAKAAVPTAQKSQIDHEKVEVTPTEKSEAKMPYDQRMQDIESAIKRAKDMFVVRDNSFTIFKDSSGRYITRITSLRDGSVTYYPEPEIVARLKSAGISLSPTQVNV